MAHSRSTICLPVGKGAYLDVIDDPGRFRAWLDTAFLRWPELFPEAFARGYRLEDDRASAKRGLRLRRVRLRSTGQSYSVRPSFVLPYMTGSTDEVQGPLFLRAFGVPFWAIARVFGEDPMYWYRLEVGPGRNGVAGTTALEADLPEHLLAGEHHRRRDGGKNHIATTVGGGCCLGAALAQTAGNEDLRAAYAVFAREAEDAQPGYRPKAAGVDGWAATRHAWLALFPLAVLLRCFPHGWPNIRSRAEPTETFAAPSEKAWHAYHAATRKSFGQRRRRPWEWSKGSVKAAWVLEQVKELCGRSKEYGLAYAHPGGHRTSNVLDRVMRSTSGYFEDCQHLHGGEGACERHRRAWALPYDFRPWHPATARANGGWRCPAERPNGHRYHDDWLRNLLVSASRAGYRR